VRVLAIIGWSGSGKTTLLTALLPILAARGLRLSTIKHAHEGFELDREGKDSWRHRQAGAREVLVASRQRWALMHEMAEREEPDLPSLLARLAPVDLVLVEGFKSGPCPKLEVHRPALGQPPLWPSQPDILAVASDAALPDCPYPVLALGAPEAVADWVLAVVMAGAGWSAASTMA